MDSMTGFGRGEATGAGGTIVVELRGVNSKSSEVKARVPRELAFLEADIGERVRRSIGRGRVDCVVTFTARHASSARALRVDPVALAALVDSLFAATAGDPRIEPSLRAGDLLRAPGVVHVDEPPLAEEALRETTLAAVDVALEELQRARRAEGALLKDVLVRHLDRLGELQRALAGRAAGASERARERLTRRINELVGPALVDPQRLAQEVALLAERADVTEELARLDAHLTHSRALLDDAGPVGRKLDFLCQELHREANTTGSKSSDVESAHLVVELKAEIERLREQVQNVL